MHDVPCRVRQRRTGSDDTGRADGTRRAWAERRPPLVSDRLRSRHDGAGHQIKINKASASDTASLLYQSGWAGRAEMGLSGSDDFSIKVSANGSDWLAALVIDKATGHAGFGTYAPARAVHIASVLRLEPSAAPASPAAGDIYYDSTSNKLRCHDGTLWHDLF